MCKVMKVHRSGYYQWLNQPISNRESENKKLLTHIKEAYKESNGVYGSRNIHKVLAPDTFGHPAGVDVDSVPEGMWTLCRST